MHKFAIVRNIIINDISVGFLACQRVKGKGHPFIICLNCNGKIA